MSTLDILDEWREQEERVAAIYEDTLAACGFRNPPDIALADLQHAQATKGMAAWYFFINHEILIDMDYVESHDDAAIRGAFAHALAHAQAGVLFKDSPLPQFFENKNIKSIRAAGLDVVQAEPQGGTIPASDWRSWSKLIGIAGGGFALIVLAAIEVAKIITHQL
jgi:dTDP-4-amino-4,6-dideoxygalactose transaminase